MNQPSDLLGQLEFEGVRSRMEEFNHRGPVIILAATAMLLLSLSLTQPWFTIRDTKTEGIVNGSSVTTEHTISIHLRYYTTDNGYMSYEGYPYTHYPLAYDNLGFDTRISHLMGFINSDLWLCLFLAWLMMMAAVLNSRLATLVLGWITASACILTAIVFSGRVPEAVRASSESLDNWPIGFITGLFGSRNTQWGTQYFLTDQWSWGPGLGWTLAVVASVLLCVVIVLTLVSAYHAIMEHHAMKESETEAAQTIDSERSP